MARYRFTVIKTDGTVIHTEQDTVPDYKQLQEAVSGFIETVPYFRTYDGEHCVAFVNEEGKLEGRAFNEAATVLWHAQGYRQDILVGDVVIVSGTELALEEL